VHCWASILGDCGGRQSGEHVVSKGLFRGKAVHVRGLHWCAGEFKTIGLKGLEARGLWPGPKHFEVDGEVKIAGRVPSVLELKEILST
jgi:hypothetical protein